MYVCPAAKVGRDVHQVQKYALISFVDAGTETDPVEHVADAMGVPELPAAGAWKVAEPMVTVALFAATPMPPLLLSVTVNSPVVVKEVDVTET